MSREKRTRRYETMIVLRADLQEAGTKEQLDRIRRLLEANGGTIEALQEWGMRELAYSIEKQGRGYYVLAEYTGTAATVAELERHLKLSDVILRFVSVRQEKGTQPAPLPRYDERVSSLEGDTADDEDSVGTEVETKTGDLES